MSFLSKMLHSVCNLLSDRNIKIGIWYSLLNSFFVFLISTKYFAILFAESANILPAYSVLACISHFSVLTFLPFIIFYLPIYLLTKKISLARWVTVVVAVLSLVILTIDSYVFSLYRFHLNSYVLEQVFGPDSGQVFELSWALYLLLVVVATVLILLQRGVFFLAEKITDKVSALFEKRFLVTLLIVWVFAFVSVQIYRTYALFSENRVVLTVERNFPLVAPIYPERFFGMNEKYCDLHTIGHTYNYPKNKIVGKSKKKNLLIIGLDSWRASTMDSVCTPNIYRFAKKTSQYQKHYSGSNGTRTGVFSLFYGLPGTYFRDFRAQQIEPVLMRLLRENDYDVRLYPSASLRNPPLDETVFCSYKNQCNANEGLNAWLRDENLAKNFRKFLVERDTTQNFFAFLFFDSLHSMIKPDNFDGPFQPAWSAAHYERLGVNTDPTEFYNLYKNMVYYVDSITGLILEEVEESGLLENTIIVITGDHAQEFNDNRHGFWGHTGNFSASQLQVPFLYYVPGGESKKFTEWTSHYDVAPTLLRDMFDVQNPVEDYTIGVPLDSVKNREYLVVDAYTGVGVIDKEGNIANYFYDDMVQFTNAQLDDDFSKNRDLQCEKVLEQTLQTFIDK